MILIPVICQLLLGKCHRRLCVARWSWSFIPRVFFLIGGRRFFSVNLFCKVFNKTCEQYRRRTVKNRTKRHTTKTREYCRFEKVGRPTDCLGRSDRRRSIDSSVDGRSLSMQPFVTVSDRPTTNIDRPTNRSSISRSQFSDRLTTVYKFVQYKLSNWCRSTANRPTDQRPSTTADDRPTIDQSIGRCQSVIDRPTNDRPVGRSDWLRSANFFKTTITNTMENQDQTTTTPSPKTTSEVNPQPKLQYPYNRWANMYPEDKKKQESFDALPDHDKEMILHCRENIERIHSGNFAGLVPLSSRVHKRKSQKKWSDEKSRIYCLIFLPGVEIARKVKLCKSIMSMWIFTVVPCHASMPPPLLLSPLLSSSSSMADDSLGAKWMGEMLLNATLIRGLLHSVHASSLFRFCK